jgi:hydroxyacyl-ACP dehydratase HTD2-like protein with hotdog domain
MWAGGSISWPNPNPSSPDDPDRGLRIGRQVFEKRNIDKVEYKEAKDMVFIHQQRKIWDIDLAGNDDMWGVKEVRIHVFRPPSSPASTSSNVISTTSSSDSNATINPIMDPPPDISLTYTPSTPLLFRYSALTFNAHKIHYDHPHSKSVEQQEGPLVHGPLTATLLIELAVTAGKEKGKCLVDFEYRAVSPIVVDREVQLIGRWTDGALEMAARQGGRVGMKATARYA